MDGEPLVKRVLFSLLLLSGTFASAQQRMVTVRLFWQHPPERIRLEGTDVRIRQCETCMATSLDGTTEMVARGDQVLSSSTAAYVFLLSGSLRISGDGFPTFPINHKLRIEARDGLLLLTLDLPLEDYVAAVLQGESGGFRSQEALKAMAVAARTYATRFRPRHKIEGFDFCDTTHCQDVRFGNESPRVRLAVNATQGELLWFEGRPAATYYHRSCGGELEDANALEPDLRAPYLRQHRDEYCSRSDEWNVEISKADLSRVFGYPVDTITVVARTKSGRAQKLLLNGKPVSATDFRLAIGRALGWEKIRSDLYQVEDRGDRISFRGRGQGHGVGLCQAGAEQMGAAGKTYREILAYYYPGTAIGLNAQGLEWQKMPGESVDLLSTSKSDAALVLPAAEAALRFANDRTGWKLAVRPQIKVYPSIDVYRDATGEPGWVAASTRGNVIRLQPVAVLQRTGALESTLRHEFLHMLIESQARPDTPLWLREGLTIYLSNPDAAKPAQIDVAQLERRLNSIKTEAEMRDAYRDCASAVAEAIQRHGRQAVLEWVKTGIR